MYSSLKSWCVFPCTLHHNVGATKAGDAQYTQEEIKCYRVDAVTQLVDNNDNSFLSSQHLYVDADINVTTYDMVSFPEKPELLLKVRKIGAYYDGNEATKSLSIIYL